MNRELRQKLELNIIHRGDDLYLMLTNIGIGDLESTYYRAYIDTWKQLIEYYKENNDTEISASMLDEIATNYRVLNGLFAVASPDQITLVQEAINEFEWVLNSITLISHRYTRKNLTQGKSN